VPVLAIYGVETFNGTPLISRFRGAEQLADQDLIAA
jgi:hypothetical protein